MRIRRATSALAALLCATVLGPRQALAVPEQFVPVNDRVLAELRVLDLYDPALAPGRVALPHLGSGPWQVAEILRPPASGDSRLAIPTGARGIALTRVLRALHRDEAFHATPDPLPTWPRVATGDWPEDRLRMELSAGLEGEGDFTRAAGHDDARAVDGTGLHVRTGVRLDRWLAYSHLYFGELRGVGAFGDALVTNTNFATSTEESYLAYTAGDAWSAQLGRSRWAWGPGEEGSLLLSRTMAPISGLALAAHLRPLRADGFVLNATVDPGTGEQLAAHRVEWQPRVWARLGLSEAARYRAGGWQGLYLAGVIPYAIVQKLLDQDHRDSTDALRNNVMVAADASLRIADGSRIYGEVLVDDLHARVGSNPDKYAWQAGWSGTGDVSGTRLAWNVEGTWLSRYVYTSYFGRSYAAQGRPLGFPTGPGSRRFRARVTWDPDADWSFGVIAARTEHGAEGLADPFVFGTPVPDVGSLAAPVTRTRSVDASARWWPSGGVDFELRAGRVWSTGTPDTWRGAVVFQLTR